MAGISTRLRLPVAAPFDLALVVHGHGWVELAPFRWDGTTLRINTYVGDRVHALAIRQGRDALNVTVTSPRKLRPAERDALRQRVRRVLALDEDLTEFWARCEAHPDLAWVAEHGAGRLLRSPTRFEDLMKILFTTNCTWANTRTMSDRLVAELGERCPEGERCFPRPERCAERDEQFWRERVRVGYRSRAARHLSEAFASGELSDELLEDPERPTEDLRQLILSLPGFGPYGAGQALRLLGRYDDLAIDSAVRAEMARRQGKRKPPSDKALARRYASFEEFAGLALWMDFAAKWHDAWHAGELPGW